jgi:hypothetical protein
MISRTQDNGTFDVSHQRAEANNNSYNPTEQNKYQHKKMTVEHDSLTRLTNKILIVDDHPYYSRIQECITTRYQPRK